MRKVNVISTVVQKDRSGARIQTGKTIIVQGYADINELKLALEKFFLSQTLNENAEGLINFLQGIGIKGQVIDKVIGALSEDVADDKSVYTAERVAKELEMYLRKDKDDRSKGVIASDKGIEVGNFEEGTLGQGAAMYVGNDKNTYVEADFLKVRKKATFTEITVQELKHVGGEIVLSPAAMVCSKVEELSNGWKCYFNTEDSDGRKVYQEFEVGDQARCQTFNLSPKGANDLAGNHYYWRFVTAVGDDFIVLSKTDCDANSDEPRTGDNIAQLGNRTDTKRQAAIILSAFGEDAPSYKQYNGINGFSLVGKQVTKLSPNGNELTGVLNIEAGSTGVKNLGDFPDEVYKAVQIGGVNLIRNSGFTGEYMSEEMTSGKALDEVEQLYSKALKHWNGSVSLLDEAEAVSGFAVQVGELSQNVDVLNGESYVASFKARGGSISVSLGSRKTEIALTSVYERYVVKFDSDGNGVFKILGNADVYDIQLERGTIATDWNPSPYDNDKTLAEFQSLKYIQDAIINGSTDVIGGLILTSMLKLGNYKNGKLQKVNAGVSGIYNDADDVAFWAGGQLEDAIRTVVKFKSNPMYRPTDEEWSKLANFAVSHGGDVFLRGYVYALGGYFRGAVEIANGKIMLNDDGSGSLASDGIKWDANGLMYRKATDVIVWTRPDKSELDYKKGSYFDLSTQMYGSYSTIILPNPPSDGYRICISLKKYIGTDSHRLSGMFYIYDEKEDQYVPSYILSIYRWSQGEFWLTYHEGKGWYLEASEYTITDESTILGRKLTYVIGDNVDSRTEISEDKFKTKKVEVTDTSDDSIKTNGGVKVDTKVLVGDNTEIGTLIERSMVKSDTIEARTEMKSPKMTVSGTGADSISTNGGVSAKEISLTGSMGRSLFLASPSEGIGNPTFRAISDSDVDGYAEMKTKVQKLADDVVNNNVDIISLKEKVNTITTENTTLTEKVTKLETDYAALLERVVELEKKHSDTN